MFCLHFMAINNYNTMKNTKFLELEKSGYEAKYIIYLVHGTLFTFLNLIALIHLKSKIKRR